MDKVKLFSLTVVVCTVFFYSFPSSKRSVYLMPAYPFLALFLAQYFLYLAERRAHVTRLFAGVLVGIVLSVIAATLLHMSGLLNLHDLAARYVTGAFTRATVLAAVHALSPNPLSATIIAILLFSLATIFYQMHKKINIKILYATIFLVLSVHLFIDGVIMREIRREGSARSFAEEVRKTPGLDKTNVYVMNDLRKYGNLYGMNFYLGNCFRNLETVRPQSGFFLAAEKDFHAVVQRYATEYDFQVLRISEKIIADTRSKIVLSRFACK
jgi:hypothetical protein